MLKFRNPELRPLCKTRGKKEKRKEEKSSRLRHAEYKAQLAGKGEERVVGKDEGGERVHGPLL